MIGPGVGTRAMSSTRRFRLRVAIALTVAAAALGWWFAGALGVPFLGTWIVLSLFGILLLGIVGLDRWSAVLGADRRRTLQSQEGVVTQTLDPEGKVRLGSELWTARTEGEGLVAAGERVRVLSRDGLVVVVEPLTPVSQRPVR